jgi:hypothetical protein
MYRKNMYDRISEERERKERLERERLAQEALKPPPPERFLANEVSFVRPESLKDKTFHVFTLTEFTPSPFSLVIGRSLAARDASLESLAQRLLGEVEKTLSHLQWIEPVTPTEVAGLEARQVEFRWRQQGQPIHQIQVMFLHQDEHGQRLLMQITATSNNPKGMTTTERDVFTEVINSFELRSPPGANEGANEAAPE